MWYLTLNHSEAGLVHIVSTDGRIIVFLIFFCENVFVASVLNPLALEKDIPMGLFLTVINCVSDGRMNTGNISPDDNWNSIGS